MSGKVGMLEDNGSQSVVPGTTVFPGSLLEMHTLGLHPRPPVSESPGLGPSSRWVWAYR